MLKRSFQYLVFTFIFVLLSFQADAHIASHPLLDGAEHSNLTKFQDSSGVFSLNSHEFVDLGTLYVRASYTDIDLPGPHGFDLKYGRIYNSTNAYQNFQGSGDSALGWDFGLEVPHIILPTSSCNQKGRRKGCLKMLELPDGSTQYIYPFKVMSPDAETTDIESVSVSGWRIDEEDYQHHSPGPIARYYTIVSPKNIHYKLYQPGSTSVAGFAEALDGYGNTIIRKSIHNGSAYIANDGREIDVRTIDHHSFVVSIPGGGKWTYNIGQIGRDYYELYSVSLPDGKEWQYRYVTPKDSYGNSAEDLSSVINPSGGETAYNYFYNHKDLDRDYVSSAKKINNKKNIVGTWSFTREGVPNQHKETIVTGPLRKQIYRYAYIYGQTGKDGWWKQYALDQVQTIDIKSGSLFRIIEYTWKTLPVFAAKGVNHPSVCTVTDGCFVAASAVPSQKTITQASTTYTTDYSDFDLYGHPQTIKETGNGGATRTEKLTYFNEPDLATKKKWVVGLLKTEMIEGVGTSIAKQFNENGGVTQVDHYGVPTKYTYDAHGNVASQTDANDHTISYSDYSHGIAQSIHYPDDTTVTKKVNPTGTIASQTDQRGNTTKYTYDKLNRVINITPPRGASTNITYNDAKSGPGGSTSTRANDQVVTKTDGFGHVTETEKTDLASKETIVQTMRYDALGRLLFKSFAHSPSDANAASVGTYHTYDVLNRSKSLQLTTQSANDAGATKYTYNYLTNNRVEIIDPKGHKVVKAYQSYGDPSDVQLIEIQQAPNLTSITKIARDAAGHVLSVEQGDLTRKYTYNSHYYLSSIANPENGITVLTYDAIGNLLDKNINGTGEINYTYDSLNRLLTTAYSDSEPAVKRAYDECGNLTTLSKGTATWTYGYDANGNRVMSSLNLAGTNYAFSYVYDALDHLAQILYPNKVIVPFMPDAFGRPTQLGQYAKNIQYFPTGQLKSLTYQNGTTLAQTLNDHDLVKSIISNGPSGNVWVVSRQYQYDPNENISNITDENNKTISLAYDGMNRVVTANGPWGSGTINYDQSNNITQKIIGAQNNVYHYDPTTNRLLNITGSNPETFQYDALGNVTSNGKNHFVYSTANHLTSASNTSVEDAYEYDGNGHLVRRETTSKANQSRHGQASTQTELSIYNQAGDLLYDANPGDNWTKTSIYLNHHKLVQLNTGSMTEKFDRALHLSQPLITGLQTVYFYNDVLGSPIGASNASGQLLWQENYQPYGKRINQKDAGVNTQWYTGKTHFKDIGLTYMGARYYDPNIGRFMSVDPAAVQAGKPATFNRYSYANDNPYRYTDPTGMFSFSDFCHDVMDHMMGNVGDMSRGFNYGVTAGMLNQGYDGHPIAYGLGEVSGLAVGAFGTDEIATAARGVTKVASVVESAERGGADLKEAGNSKVPGSWGEGLPNKKGVGYRWNDPDNPGNGVRIDKGDPGNSFPSQRVDHVVVRNNGRVIGRDGASIDGSIKANPEQAHVPLNEWRAWSSWNSP